MTAADRGDGTDDTGTADGAWEVVGSDTLFGGHIISLRQDRVRMPDGSIATREVVSHIGAVGVVALGDDAGPDTEVVLVNQFRHPVRRRLDELPAGLLDVAGESALEAARRELLEEAGLVADHWHVLLDLHTSPGFSDEAIRIFLARDLHTAESGFERESEELTMTARRTPLAEAVRRVGAGEITNAPAVAGLLAAAHGVVTGWTGLRPADAPWPARPGR